MTRFWHPFADMAAIEANGALSLVRGRGSHVWDADGNRYLDATGGLWFCNVGHGRAEIAEAADRQLRELASYHTFGDLTNPPTEALVERVASLAPIADPKVFLTSRLGPVDTARSSADIGRSWANRSGRPRSPGARTTVCTAGRRSPGIRG
jgi:adenosylmethionine-8-amino-7-oxononanoate aminotransferase